MTDLERDVIDQAERLRALLKGPRTPETFSAEWDLAVAVDRMHAANRPALVPDLRMVCDHQGGPGTVDENGECNEYHCEACCPDAQGRALDRLERGPAPKVEMSVRIKHGPTRPLGPTAADGAERFALDILAEVGAVRRGDR